MIKFEFNLSVDDADLLWKIIHSSKLDAISESMDFKDSGNLEIADFCYKNSMKIDNLSNKIFKDYGAK